MTFKNINGDIDCDCTKGTIDDLENLYIRKLRKDTLQEADFLSHWERGIKPEIENCESSCSYKGISVNQYHKSFEEQIINKFKTTFKINPKKGAYYLKFKIPKDAGVYKFAPEIDDESHYNFLKSDNFDVTCLESIETIKFA